MISNCTPIQLRAAAIGAFSVGGFCIAALARWIFNDYLSGPLPSSAPLGEQVAATGGFGALGGIVFSAILYLLSYNVSGDSAGMKSEKEGLIKDPRRLP